MNTVGRFFENKDKRHVASPDFSGVIQLTEPFTRSCIAAFKAHRDSGKSGVCEAVIDGRWKDGPQVRFMALNVTPPKVP